MTISAVTLQSSNELPCYFLLPNHLKLKKKEHCISESGDGEPARERGCEGKREIYVEFGPVRKREALKCIIKTGVLRFSVLADNSVL